MNEFYGGFAYLFDICGWILPAFILWCMGVVMGLVTVCTWLRELVKTQHDLLTEMRRLTAESDK